VLDDYWSNRQYPDRNILLYEMEGEINEEGLISFLKKFGKNEIFSFMVRNQEERYTFPILVTKRYLKKNGKDLMEKASTIINEQKDASMPDQDLFDFCISLDDFLKKTLPKI
jgi:hemerythrin superfamily protein